MAVTKPASPTSDPESGGRSAAIRRRLERQYIVYKPASASELERQLADAEDNTDVVVDLSAIDGFDAGAAAVVAQHHPRLEARASTLVMANVPAEARRVLDEASLAPLIRRRR